MFDKFKDIVVASGAMDTLKEALAHGAAIEKAQQLLRDFNETVPTLKALGLSVSDMSFKMGIPPEIAATLDEFELWDAALHQAIATATHNRFVVRVLDMVTAVRQQAEWGKLKDRIVTPERRIKYQEEHRNIVRALRERDADLARARIIEHLQHARRNLFGF